MLSVSKGKYLFNPAMCVSESPQAFMDPWFIRKSASGLNRGLTGFDAQKLEAHQWKMCILGRKVTHLGVSIETSIIVPLTVVLPTHTKFLICIHHLVQNT